MDCEECWVLFIVVTFVTSVTIIIIGAVDKDARDEEIKIMAEGEITDKFYEDYTLEDDHFVELDDGYIYKVSEDDYKYLKVGDDVIIYEDGTIKRT